MGFSLVNHRTDLLHSFSEVVRSGLSYWRGGMECGIPDCIQLEKSLVAAGIASFWGDSALGNIGVVPLALLQFMARFTLGVVLAGDVVDHCLSKALLVG